MTESWIKYNKKTDLFYFSAGLLLGVVLLATFYNTPTLYFKTVNDDSIFGQANQVRFYQWLISDLLPKKLRGHKISKFRFQVVFDTEKYDYKIFPKFDIFGFFKN